MTSLPELVLSRTRADSSQAWYWAKLRARRGPREPAARDVPVCTLSVAGDRERSMAKQIGPVPALTELFGLWCLVRAPSGSNGSAHRRGRPQREDRHDDAEDAKRSPIPDPPRHGHPALGK